MISIDAAFAVQDHQDHLRLAEARRPATRDASPDPAAGQARRSEMKRIACAVAALAASVSRRASSIMKSWIVAA